MSYDTDDVRNEFGPCSCQDSGKCRYVNGGPACMNEESLRATPSENLMILRARLWDHLSPEERNELHDAAALLDHKQAPSAIGATPRTDAVVGGIATYSSSEGQIRDLIEHACQLERELAEAKATIQRQLRYAEAVADAVDAAPSSTEAREEEVMARADDEKLSRYILNNLIGWNCGEIVSDEQRDRDFLALMLRCIRKSAPSAIGESKALDLLRNLRSTMINHGYPSFGIGAEVDDFLRSIDRNTLPTKEK